LISRKRKGAFVVNLIYTTGHRAHIPKIDARDDLSPEQRRGMKIQCREAEIARSAAFLKLDKHHFLRLGFYDRKNPDMLA